MRVSIFLRNWRDNFSHCVLALLFVLCCLTACDDDVPRVSAAGKQKGSDDILNVGDVKIYMAVQSDFIRIAPDHPIMRAAQTQLGRGEIILGIFERKKPELENDFSIEGLLRRDILRITTLEKWLNSHFTAEDFDAQKRAWQDQSTPCDQKALDYFKESVAGKLSNVPHFSYQLGMIDNSATHISFVKVTKNTTPDGKAVFVCATNSLIWRKGKILSINYSKHMENLGEIQGVIAESVDYLRKLQRLDEQKAGAQSASAGTVEYEQILS